VDSRAFGCAGADVRDVILERLATLDTMVVAAIKAGAKSGHGAQGKHDNQGSVSHLLVLSDLTIALQQ